MVLGNALQTMQTLLTLAAQKKSSDLHILVGKPPILRIEGELLEQTDYPSLNAPQAQALIYSILNKRQQAEFISEKEVDFSYEVPGVSRFRVNVMLEKDNMGLVARVISNDIPTMEGLSMPKIVYELARLKQGLILVTGPTGCGKSTSMAAMIDLINKERKTHIITLEDPIEYIFESDKSYIRQRQMFSDFLSFDQALKHVVRQDPNVIMVGEMRDLETIGAAITVAETGHLVFATLHTLGAAQTIDRIIDVFPPHQQEQIRLQLSMELRGVVSQQLVPSINGNRIAAREIMLNTPAVSNLIRENKVAQLKSVLQTGAETGMVSLDQDMKRLYEQGLITKDVLRMYTVRPGA
ncbi:MAG: type IV pilus twitching motility protein PilT [Patescibacteria group bacterium]|jgi:twitching motility protein PilT